MFLESNDGLASNKMGTERCIQDFTLRTNYLGSGCGSVGRAVASDTRDLRFKSRHWQNFIYQLYNRKDENKEKDAGNGPS